MPAQFTFPLSFDTFRSMLPNGSDKTIAKAMNVEPEDAIEHLYGCAKQGWMSKQYHKAKQLRDAAILERVEELRKKDPELDRRLKAQDKSATR